MNCPMCGELWNGEVCESCGWSEVAPVRYQELRCQVCKRPYVNTAACCGNPHRQRYEPNRDPEE
jgi:hypothetical protein